MEFKKRSTPLTFVDRYVTYLYTCALHMDSGLHTQTWSNTHHATHK
jgi:hypothetical protein